MAELTRRQLLMMAERLERYEQALSAVMPPDFKCWWQNSRDEWPDVAAGVIKDLRMREELAWQQLGSQPVPVSERLPGPEDCLEIHSQTAGTLRYCWLGMVLTHAGVERLVWDWRLILPEDDRGWERWSYWLPANTRYLPTLPPPREVQP